MASAKDYGLTPGRGFNPPNHNGKDWAAPMSTNVFPGDSRMKTGSTGKSTGPHLHTQAGPDFYAQKFIDPTRHEFQPGKVVQVGWGDEWGNYVIVKNFTSGIYVVYAHLSEIDVEPGDVIREDEMLTSKGQMRRLWLQFLGREPRTEEYAGYINNRTYAYTVAKLSKARKDLPSALARIKELENQPPIQPPEATVLEPGRYEVK